MVIPSFTKGYHSWATPSKHQVRHCILKRLQALCADLNIENVRYFYARAPENMPLQ